MHLLATSYDEGPAREALQRSLRTFWESIAAALLQPELPLQDFAALACGLHQQGRSLLAAFQQPALCALRNQPAINSCIRRQAC